MSIQALNWALSCDEIKSQAARHVLLILANYSDENGECYPSRETIAKKTAVGLRSVQTHLNFLVEKGYISKESRRLINRQSSNYYRIVDGRFQGANNDNLRVQNLHPENSQGANSDNLRVQITTKTHDSQGANIAPYTKERIRDTKERKLKKPKVGETPPGPPKISDAEKVFDFWKKIHRKGPRQTFTDKRKKAVIARLKNYSVADIFDAIEGCRRTPHNQGYNSTQTKYDDLELICRNDTQLERFIENAALSPIPDINESRRNPGPGKESAAERDAEYIPPPPCDICGRELCNRADCGQTRRERMLHAA